MTRLLKNADKQRILDYLARNEIETSFLYANIIEFGVENRLDMRRCADYYGFFKGRTLKGILPFYNLGSCIPHYETDAAVPAFIRLMKEREFEFLLGMQKVVKPLYESIRVHKEIKSYDECSYFINRNLRPFSVDGVNFVNADGASGEEVVEFIVDARAKGFNQPAATREDVKKSLTQRGEEEEFLIAVKDGKIVAQACVQTYTSKINQIGSVYTAEEERGKGYCKAIVSEICKRIIAKGKTPTLSVKKKNIPAVRAYTALGFEPYDDYLIIQC